MLNFIHWVAIHKKDIKSLRELSIEQLLEIVNEYEGGKLTGNNQLTGKWRSGFWSLLESDDSFGGYDQVRLEMEKMGLG